MGDYTGRLRWKEKHHTGCWIKTQKMGKDVLGRGRRARTEGIKEDGSLVLLGLGLSGGGLGEN